jgi:predicted transcriptional regulator
MVMAKLDQRVNLRIDSDTYAAYEKVASFFNRTVPDIMREALQESVPTMQTLGTIIDRAKAGDAEAMQKLFTSMIEMHQGQLNMATEVAAAEMKTIEELRAQKSGQV